MLLIKLFSLWRFNITTVICMTFAVVCTITNAASKRRRLNKSKNKQSINFIKGYKMLYFTNEIITELYNTSNRLHDNCNAKYYSVVFLFLPSIPKTIHSALHLHSSFCMVILQWVQWLWVFWMDKHSIFFCIKSIHCELSEDASQSLRRIFRYM